jgi:uncharacterized protein YbjT (DUF2867 family)
MPRKILVTGATGTTAGPLVGRLVKKGHAVRALVHSSSKSDAVRQQGAEVVVGGFDDASALRTAFSGIDMAFLVVPPSPDAAKWNRALFAAAREAGSPQVVRLSVFNSAEDGPTDNTKLHGESDRDLRASGLPYTILRPHFFMQNLFGSARTIGSDGVMYWGMGDGRLAMIDTRDITDAAFAVLDAPDPKAHQGKAYDLTGPESITFHQVADVLTRVSGRTIRYVPVPPAAVVQSLRDMGAPEWMANVMGQYSKAYSENWGNRVADGVKTLTGREPRSFETFAREVFVPALQGARG